MAHKRKLTNLKRHPRVSEFLAGRMMQTLEYAESHAERYNHSNPGNWRDFDFKAKEIRCDSACCFAGHTVAMYRNYKTPADIQSHEVVGEAIRLLRVKHLQENGFYDFFDLPHNWPREFKNSQGKVTLVEVRQRVEHFIETGSMF